MSFVAGLRVVKEPTRRKESEGGSEVRIQDDAVTGFA